MTPGYRNRTYILCCGEQPNGGSVGRTERIKLVIAMETIRLSLSSSINGFWLHLWYLQSLLSVYNIWNHVILHIKNNICQRF